MCTVVYCPLSNEEYLLGSIRDESPKRATQKPAIVQGKTGQLLYAKDEHKEGTWLACHSSKRLITLLNGGLKSHYPNVKTYPESRGKLVLNVVDQQDWKPLLAKEKLGDFEPFTMVIRDAVSFVCVRWNGESPEIEQLNPLSFYIWSSSTLYTPEIQNLRESKFRAWIESNPNYTIESIRTFFDSYKDKHNGFVMNREKTSSVSMSLVKSDQNGFLFDYEDFTLGEKTNIVLNLDKG